MRFAICFFLVLNSLLHAPVFGQELVSTTLLGSKTKAQLLSQFNIPFIQFGVNYYRISYTTPNLQGAADTVSGLLVMPDNTSKIYPRLVYQHGTSGSKQDVPSFNYNGGEGSVGLLFGGLGYVALLPDYLGLGLSDGFHPYVHAASEASAALDMLRAAEDFTTTNNIQTNSQLFITGYSQGGHAAMALQREIEKNQSAEFSVTASAPLSGPYSIGEVMRALILTDEVYYYPAYIPNTILSYQTAYGNLFDEITDVFKPAYSGLIAQFYAGTLDLSDLNDQLIVTLVANEGESRPYRMFQDSIVQTVANDPAHPFNIALKANNTYTDWTPQAPTRLYYCMADDQVPFENSILARDTLLVAGAADLQILDVNSTADHGDCYVPALTNAMLFFLGLQQIGTVSSIRPLDAGQLEFSPNPANTQVIIRDLPANGRLSIVAYDGRILKTLSLQAGTHSLSVQDIPEGVYMIEFRSGRSAWNEKIIIKH